MNIAMARYQLWKALPGQRLSPGPELYEEIQTWMVFGIEKSHENPMKMDDLRAPLFQETIEMLKTLTLHARLRNPHERTQKGSEISSGEI